MPRVRPFLLAFLLGAARATCPGHAHAQAQAAGPVAVLAFEDGGSYGQDQDGFEALRVGIPVVLRGELARLGVPVTPRDPETARRAHAHLDAATAAAVATAAGASHAVIGSFIDFYGKLRINARVIESASGEIVAVVSNEDRTQQDRALIAVIIHRDAVAIAAVIAAPPSTLAPRHFTAQAVTLLGRGVLAEAAGQRQQAADYYAQALAASPDLTEASERAKVVGH